MEVLNSGDVTRFYSQTGTFTSSLCSPNTFLDFTSRVLPDLYGSDPFPMILKLKLGHTLKQRVTSVLISVTSALEPVEGRNPFPRDTDDIGDSGRGRAPIDGD